ncbi:MAG: hypothetical protein Q8K45_05705 [Rubrivivax sp.]|nr:hypothetical protein [Rubrivivax sp.]
MSLTRKISVATILGAGLLLASASQAQDVQVRSDNAAKARATMAASMKAAARGQKVGMLSGRANPAAVVAADGTISQELDAGTMSYSVARRNADGSIEMVCVNGAEAAQKALKAPAFAKRVSQVAQEQSHVR